MSISATGVILAGGKSSRMGRDKALLLLNNQTLLAHSVEKISDIFSEVIIVTNQVGNYYFPGVKEVVDIYSGRGPLGGIHAALKAAKYEYIFVVACDMPFWEKGLVRLLLEACTGFEAAVPRLSTHVEPLLAVYNKSCLPIIESCLERNITKTIGFYPFVRVNYVGIDRLETVRSPELAFKNINTPEDYYKISTDEPKSNTRDSRQSYD